VAAVLVGREAADPADAAVRELLTAASAPATAAELRGESAALSAFQAAHRQPIPDTRSGPAMRQSIARLLTVKAATIAVAVTATGGVAIAAGTGVLPSSGTGSVTVTPVNQSTPTATPSAGAALGQTAVPVAAPTHKDWTGLCNAAMHGNLLHNPGKAAHSAAFSKLITAAGGVTQLPAFCAAMLGATPSHTAAPAAAAPVANCDEQEHSGPAVLGQQARDDQGDNEQGDNEQGENEQGEGQNCDGDHEDQQQGKPGQPQGKVQGDDNNRHQDENGQSRQLRGESDKSHGDGHDAQSGD
jgi:hypothetical protein